MAIEVYHDLEQYLLANGPEMFLQHVKDYFQGKKTIPVSRASSAAGKDITFTFTDDLLKLFLRRPKQVLKPYEVAVKYGFRGYSRGGKNGIFLQNNDSELERQTEALARKYAPEIKEELLANDADSFKKVKIVSHNPVGKRIVGLYSPGINRILFLNFANY